MSQKCPTMSPHQEATVSSTSSLIWGLKEYTEVVEFLTGPWSSLCWIETTLSIQVSIQSMDASQRLPYLHKEYGCKSAPIRIYIKSMDAFQLLSYLHKEYGWKSALISIYTSRVWTQVSAYQYLHQELDESQRLSVSTSRVWMQVSADQYLHQEYGCRSALFSIYIKSMDAPALISIYIKSMDAGQRWSASTSRVWMQVSAYEYLHQEYGRKSALIVFT